MDKIRVGIVGVSGYGGGELARLLAQHPRVELTYATSGTYAGQPLQHALPGITPFLNLICEKFASDACTDRCDFVFLAGESGLAMETAPALLAAGKKIVDLSADFRLQDPQAYAHWYKAEHRAAHLLEHAVYGLPELNKEAIAKAQLVANPGCHVTAAVLGLAPLLAAQAVKMDTLIVDSLTGVSGAGRSKFGLEYHFAEINESARPYGVGGVHRHTPEIEQALSRVAGVDVKLTFTPHLVPITRGILTTAYATLAPPLLGAGGAVTALFESGRFPATKHVNGTNFCHIGLALDERTHRVIAISAIDNLVKGAAGQAIQNMNLMCGWDETEGLRGAALWP